MAAAVWQNARARASAARLEIEQDDGGAFVERFGSAYPQMSVFSIAAANIELAHRCFVVMQARLSAPQLGEPVDQRHQSHAEVPGPLGQCRTASGTLSARPSTRSDTVPDGREICLVRPRPAGPRQRCRRRSSLAG